MNAICLVFDRLHAGYVGAYGNTWIETPSFDRLASQAFLLDQAVVDSPELERLYRSYWQGWHAMCPEPAMERASLAARLRDAGVTTALLTDEPTLARHPSALEFDQLIEIDPPWEATTAKKVGETHFARCFMRMIEWLETARGPFLLWCHLGGLGTTWDAPREFREAYQDEGDPSPPVGAEVPDRMLPADYDPDELLGVAQAYAGQVTLLDTCLGAWLDFLDALPSRDDTLLTVTSSRGFPLGEHRRVGPCDGALFGELVQVPWMMRLPDAAGAAARSQRLVEPGDLWATLLDWWKLENASPTGESLLPLARGEATAWRDRLCILGERNQRAIRTPAWFLRATDPPELFAKPDDRWEINNFASRCQEAVDGLLEALAQYELNLPTGRPSDLPPLGDLLLRGLE